MNVSRTFRSFDGLSGTLEWAYDIRQDAEQFSFHSPMLPLDSVVIAAADWPGGYMYGFARAPFRVLWKRVVGGLAGGIEGMPFASSPSQTRTRCCALTPNRGRFAGPTTPGGPAADTSKTAKNVFTPCLADSLLLYVDRARNLIALRTESGTVA